MSAPNRLNRRNRFRPFIPLAALALLCACASEPSRPLTAREQQDLRECRFAASTVAGYNMVNQAVNQEVAFRNCLHARGY